MYIPKDSLHLVMQSKGGAGKSVCSFLLSQYFIDRLGAENVQLVDTDPNNKTLGSFKGLNVKEVDILQQIGVEKTIDPAKFDVFLNDFIDSDKLMVVDTGSGEYLAITSYFRLNNTLDFLVDGLDKEVYIHCPINHGQSATDTLHCLLFLAENFGKAKIVIWDNEFFGTGSLDERLAQFSNYAGTVKLVKRQAETFGRDFSNMLINHLTFEEVRTGDHPLFMFMNKHRLNMIKNETFEQIDKIFE